eukprot:314598-Rhodomonas_salina.2
MLGTGLGRISLRVCYAMPGTDLGRLVLPESTRPPHPPSTLISSCARSAIALRACYAVSGITIAQAATTLRACYAMSGITIA